MQMSSSQAQHSIYLCLSLTQSQKESDKLHVSFKMYFFSWAEIKDVLLLFISFHENLSYQKTMKYLRLKNTALLLIILSCAVAELAVFLVLDPP